MLELIAPAVTSFLLSAVTLHIWRTRTAAKVRHHFEQLCREHRLMGNFTESRGRKLYPTALGTYRGRLVRIESVAAPGGDITRLTVNRSADDGFTLFVQRSPSQPPQGARPVPLDASSLSMVDAYSSDPPRAQDLLQGHLAEMVERAFQQGLHASGFSLRGASLVAAQEGLLGTEAKRRQAEVVLNLLHAVAEALDQPPTPH